MARIRIDIDDLVTAMSDHGFNWVLDLQTGQVLMADWILDPEEHDADLDDADPDDADPDDEMEERELDPQRYRHVDCISSDEGFRWMEQFAARQDDRRVRDHLLDALDRRRPFRSFKDALLGFPAVREAWFAYQEARQREEAEAWLEAEGIDAELVDVRQAGAPTDDMEGG